MRVELQPHGVSVSLVDPGYVQTAILEKALTSAAPFRQVGDAIYSMCICVPVHVFVCHFVCVSVPVHVVVSVPVHVFVSATSFV